MSGDFWSSQVLGIKEERKDGWSVAEQFRFLKDWKLALLVGRAKETFGDGQESSQGATHLVRGFSIHSPVLKVEIAKPCLFRLLLTF